MGNGDSDGEKVEQSQEKKKKKLSHRAFNNAGVHVN